MVIHQFGRGFGVCGPINCKLDGEWGLRRRRRWSMVCEECEGAEIKVNRFMSCWNDKDRLALP